MPTRTVKGREFSIWIDGKQVVVKHVQGKGKRCRLIVPPGTRIEVTGNPNTKYDESRQGPRLPKVGQ